MPSRPRANSASAHRRVPQCGPGRTEEGCGGGGGETAPAEPPPPPPPPPPWPVGRLACTDGVQVAVYDFEARAELRFMPSDPVYAEGGVSITRSRAVPVLQKPVAGGLSCFLVHYSAQGTPQRTINIFRERTCPISSASHSADEQRVAWAANEPVDVFGERTDRVVVYPAAEDCLRGFDGFTDPVWAGPDGSLFMRRVSDATLHRRIPTFDDLGTVDGVLPDALVGSYDVSPDGGHLAWVQGGMPWLLHRASGRRWVALADPGGRPVAQVCFTAGGLGLVAVLQRVTRPVLVAARWEDGSTVSLADSHVLTGVTLDGFVRRIASSP